MHCQLTKPLKMLLLLNLCVSLYEKQNYNIKLKVPISFILILNTSVLICILLTNAESLIFNYSLYFSPILI